MEMLFQCSLPVRNVKYFKTVFGFSETMDAFMQEYYVPFAALAMATTATACVAVNYSKAPVNDGSKFPEFNSPLWNLDQINKRTTDEVNALVRTADFQLWYEKNRSRLGAQRTEARNRQFYLGLMLLFLGTFASMTLPLWEPAGATSTIAPFPAIHANSLVNVLQIPRLSDYFIRTSTNRFTISSTSPHEMLAPLGTHVPIFLNAGLLGCMLVSLTDCSMRGHSATIAIIVLLWMLNTSLLTTNLLLPSTSAYGIGFFALFLVVAVKMFL